tara:strand:- start:260 stop:436 length:177 start_codon:yes stop_codon:yes gene_type:complete
MAEAVALLVFDVFEVLLDVFDELDSVYEGDPPPPPPHEINVNKIQINKVLNMILSLFI